MKLYMLRDKETGNWINKKYSTSNRIYQQKRHAASAASHVAYDRWRWSNDERWWSLPAEKRKEIRESMIEIVECDCVPVDKSRDLAEIIRTLENVLDFLDDSSVHEGDRELIREQLREGLRSVDWL